VNFLLRLFQTERPRAVIVGWDTLGVPTYRQRLFPNYQEGRQFDDELIDPLDALPEFVAACGFATAKSPGYEADDFLAAAAADETRRGGCALVASGDRDSFQLASDTVTILHPVRAGELMRIGPAEVRARYGVEPTPRYPILLPCAAIPQTGCRALAVLVRKVLRRYCCNTRLWKTPFPTVDFLNRPMSCGLFGRSRRWMRPRW